MAKESLPKLNEAQVKKLTDGGSFERAKKLAAKNGDEAEWQGYLQTLRARFPTLRALQEELSKAHL